MDIQVVENRESLYAGLPQKHKTLTQESVNEAFSYHNMPRTSVKKYLVYEFNGGHNLRNYNLTRDLFGYIANDTICVVEIYAGGRRELQVKLIQWIVNYSMAKKLPISIRTLSLEDQNFFNDVRNNMRKK